MIQKFVNRFTNVFLQIFLSHLRLKGYADEYGITEQDFRVKLYSNNLFEDFLETSILTQRAENFERFISYAEGDEESPALFSKKWLMKKFLKFSEDDVLENEDYLKHEKAEKETEKKKKSSSDDLDLGDLDVGEGKKGKKSKDDKEKNKDEEETGKDEEDKKSKKDDTDLDSFA